MNTEFLQVVGVYIIGYLVTYVFFAVAEDLDEYKSVEEFKSFCLKFSLVWPIMLPIGILVFSIQRIKLGDIDRLRKVFGRSTFKDRDK